MKLSQSQQNEIQLYISGNVTYSETCNELFDHIMNELESNDRKYSLQSVQEIIAEDFGGLERVKSEEKTQRYQIRSKYTKFLWYEMLCSFNFPSCLKYIIMTLFFYMMYDNGMPLNVVANICYTLLICSTFPGFYYLYKRYIVDCKLKKPSIIYGFMVETWLVWFVAIVSMVALVVHPSSLLFVEGKLKFLTLYCLALCTDIYVRSFRRLYDKKISTLTA